MARKHEGLEVAIELCKEAGVKFNYENSSKGHVKFYIDNYPRMILIGNANMLCLNAVKRDIRKAISLLTV